jgi:hypothetical protein
MKFPLSKVNRFSWAGLAVLVVWGVTAGPTWAAGLLPACAEAGGCGLCDVVGVFINFAALIVEWLGLLSVLMFIIGGVFIIIAGGSPERAKRGRQILVGTIIGSILVVSGWLIINFTLAALLNADFNSVQIFPTSYTDEANPSGGDTWYELACTPVYTDCTDVTDGQLCTSSACKTNCVCDAGSCTSTCLYKQTSGEYSSATCQASTTACAGFLYVDQCPISGSTGEAQLCCATLN